MSRTELLRQIRWHLRFHQSRTNRHTVVPAVVACNHLIAREVAGSL